MFLIIITLIFIFIIHIKAIIQNYSLINNPMKLLLLVRTIKINSLLLLLITMEELLVKKLLLMLSLKLVMFSLMVKN